MYELLVCTCGTPLGFIFEFPVFKQLNFRKEGELFVQSLSKIFDLAPQQIQYKLRQFLMISCLHFQVYQIYDTKLALELFVKQFQTYFESVPDQQMNQETIDFIYKQTEIVNLFNIFHSAKQSTLEMRTSDKNLVKEILDQQLISKTCCRTRIQTNVDFYTSRSYYAQKLHH